MEYVPTGTISPSPENDDIYGEIKIDKYLEPLVESIRNRGLEEPIIVSADNFIISGHRRFAACKNLDMAKVPIRRKEIIRQENLIDWHEILTEYNPQRIKSAGTLLKEAMIRRSYDDPREYLQSYNRGDQTEAEYSAVKGTKHVHAVSAKKQTFLRAAKKVIESMRDFWPLTVRQIHYQLLNDPPLISTPKTSKKDPEHYRYRNNDTSYNALIELLKQARYAGEIGMNVIDDPTRPQYAHNGFHNLADFLSREMDEFLCGYHRDRQLDQPRHIEVLGEKNTLMGILRPICKEYYVPLSLGRGYGSIPLWRDMAERFQRSGKQKMTLISVSDFDPEGLDLPRDGVRTLRDMWGVDIDHQRVAVNREQIVDLGLAADFNPVKKTSSRFKQFVDETGGQETWEVESLPPRFLQGELRKAIESNMDMVAYQSTLDTELSEADELFDIREGIIADLEI